MKLKTDALVGFIFCHLLALLAFVPWFFSWTGSLCSDCGNVRIRRCRNKSRFPSAPHVSQFLVPALAGAHVRPSLEHVVCSSHRPFGLPFHRRHHHFADEEQDPHSPLKSFFWAHFGWLLVRPPDMKPRVMTERYAKDVMRGSALTRVPRPGTRTGSSSTLLAWMVVFFAAGFARLGTVGANSHLGCGHNSASAFLLWGGALRTVVVWHDRRRRAVNSV